MMLLHNNLDGWSGIQWWRVTRNQQPCQTFQIVLYVITNNRVLHWHLFAWKHWWLLGVIKDMIAYSVCLCSSVRSAVFHFTLRASEISFCFFYKFKNEMLIWSSYLSSGTTNSMRWVGCPLPQLWIAIKTSSIVNHGIVGKCRHPGSAMSSVQVITGWPVAPFTNMV